MLYCEVNRYHSITQISLKFIISPCADDDDDDDDVCDTFQYGSRDHDPGCVAHLIFGFIYCVITFI